jgi:polar amino acid transport system substrate-binding protein
MMVTVGSALVRVLLVTVAFASTACVQQTAALEAELAPTGVLRAAINYNNPLLARRDAATGELRGVVVDLSRELARRVGVPVELVPYESAGSIAADASTSAWDVAYLAIDAMRAADIDFTAAYIEIEGTYLVPAGSPLQTIADVDREGVSIAVSANSAYDLFLSRELKHARLVRAASVPKSIDVMVEQKLDALASVRTALVAAAGRLPGARIMSGHFMTIPQAVAVPKGRAAAARYVHEFVEEMKASGAIAALLAKHGLGPDDAIVAPAARSRESQPSSG